jgi:hypothetical protein
MRECGECGKCCDGRLKATILGTPMGDGIKCTYYDTKCKCTIYDTRPEHPCRSYKCTWLTDEDIPDWMKPSLSNVIISYKPHPTDDSLSYYDVAEHSKKMDSVVLNWILHWAMGNSKNLIYEVDGKLYTIGNEMFLETIRKINKREV